LELREVIASRQDEQQHDQYTPCVVKVQCIDACAWESGVGE